VLCSRERLSLVSGAKERLAVHSAAHTVRSACGVCRGNSESAVNRVEGVHAATPKNLSEPFCWSAISFSRLIERTAFVASSRTR
jgi:hypothetical protein